MKITPTDVARSFLETCQSLPEEKHASVADAAITILETYGLSRSVRTFPRLVREQLSKEQGVLFASLTTPAGIVGTLEDLTETLKRGLGKDIQLTQHRDPSLIGGALLSVGDERFDASVRGALQRLQQSLSARSA